jgi:hypothetical protein
MEKSWNCELEWNGDIEEKSGKKETEMREKYKIKTKKIEFNFSALKLPFFLLFAVLYKNNSQQNIIKIIVSLLFILYSFFCFLLKLNWNRFILTHILQII